MREKISWADNVPTTVTLDSAGELQRNRAGDVEYRYFLHGDKIMWVPTEAYQAINRTDAREGDTITITRQRAKRNSTATWAVEPVTREGDGAAAIRRTETAPSSRTAASQPADREHYDRQPGQGWTYREPAKPTTDTDLPVTTTDQLAGALAVAIDAAAEASIYAKRHGLNITWNGGDIRALAATIYIQQQRGGAR